MCGTDCKCKDLEERNGERVTELLLDIIYDQKNRIISQQQTMDIDRMNEIKGERKL